MIFNALLVSGKTLEPEHAECSFPSCPLQKFAEMWYQVFLWALFSSIFVHIIAAGVAFATLRKHKFGKFFPLFIIFMGVITPITCGAVSSAAIAFVYRSSSLQMTSLHAMFWGAGQTVAIQGFACCLEELVSLVQNFQETKKAKVKIKKAFISS